MKGRHKDQHSSAGQTEQGAPEEPQAPDQQLEPEDAAVEDVDAGELLDLLKAERERADQEHERYLRALADFANYRKRQEEQAARLRQNAAKELILQLLGVMDDFERALHAADCSSNFEALHNGLEMTERKLRDILAANGVQPIEAEGAQFDPSLHEAVMRIADSEHEDNTIVNEMQKGYLIGDEVLRPSRVTVAMSE